MPNRMARVYDPETGGTYTVWTNRAYPIENERIEPSQRGRRYPDMRDKDTLLGFMRRITRLRHGATADARIRMTEREARDVEVCALMANNILAMHNTVLGNNVTSGAPRSANFCYKPLSKGAMGYDNIPIMIVPGAHAANVFEKLLTDFTGNTMWLRIPGTNESAEPRLNVWKYHALPKLGAETALLEDLREEAIHDSGRVRYQHFARDDGIHWLERKDVEEFRKFNPIASLNVRDLVRLLMDVERIGEDGAPTGWNLAERVIEVTLNLTKYVHSFNQDLHVVGFSCVNETVAGEIEGMDPSLIRDQTPPNDFDMDRVTLFIEPAMGHRDWLDRDISGGGNRHRFALDII